MPHVHSSSSPSTLRRTCLAAVVASLIPLGTAFAQSLPQVRVAGEEQAIASFRHFDDDDYVITVAAPGTVMDVLYTEGDAFRHLESNWYWVLLPRDQWGSRRAGWVSGRHVQPVPPAPRAARAPVSEAPRSTMPANEGARPAEVQPEAAPPAPAAEVPTLAPVVVHFAFDKSDLTDEAKTALNEAVAMLKTHAEGVVFALEGHADATGREAYNEKLGQARAENVKRYLAEQHEIAIEKITVVSYGENQPAAPNDTREGRAQNRRVVLKVGL